MTNYSFEPVSIPDADELGPLGEPRTEAQAEGVVPAEGVDPESIDSEESHVPELPGAAAAGSVPPGGAAVSSAPVPDPLERARAEAHRQGVEEGRRAEAERVRTAVEAVRSVVDELHVADQRREKEAGDRVAALATAVAAHLLEREVRTSPDVVSDLVRRAIAEFPVSDTLAVHMNPGDLTLLTRGIAEDSAHPQLTSGQTVRWIPDPQINPGGCLVEGGDRVVDARLTTVLERLFRVLTDA